MCVCAPYRCCVINKFGQKRVIPSTAVMIKASARERGWHFVFLFILFSSFIVLPFILENDQEKLHGNSALKKNTEEE